MRRRTKVAPIGGALVWRLSKGVATSAGNAPGTVATNCAIFITGPRRLPSTVVRSAALDALNRRVPPSARPAPRAATPVSPAETRANRVRRRVTLFSRLAVTGTPLVPRSLLINDHCARARATLAVAKRDREPAFYLSDAKIAAL